MTNSVEISNRQNPSLKIAFVVGRFPVLSEAFILNQIAGLIDRGHELDIYALEGYSGETKVHPIVSQYNLLDRVYYVPKIPDNFPLRCLKAFGLLITQGWKNPLAILKSFNDSRYGMRVFNLRLFYAAIAFLESKQYDIVHCQFGIYTMQGKYPEDAGVLALRSLGLLRGKLVTAFRGWDISWYVKEKGKGIYGELFREGDYFVTNCNFFRDRAIKIGCNPELIEVLGSGIDCDRFCFQSRHFPQDGTVRLATTGRLIEKKGIEYGIRGVAALLKEYPHLEYNIIGDGYLREELQQLVDRLGVADKIKLLGWRQQQEIIDILDRSQIFLAPCVTAKNGNQDAPVNTLKEAMAMGLPVISTYHGGIPELVQDGISGCLVAERESSAIANKLRYLIKNPQLWQDMGQNGRQFVEDNYDIHKLNDNLVAIYQNLLSK